MEKTELLACPFQRYTRTYEGGMAYLPSAGIVCRGESPELTGPAITRLALYEALLQMEPAEVALMLRRTPPPDNKALTVEELREMDGEPVYMVDLTGGTLWTQWVIFSSHSDYGFAPRGGGWFGIENYEKTWVCYRRPPEKGE